jgi:protein-L-isoaspartate O-methyltransferase
MAATVNTQELEAKVKDMYRQVAENPHGDFHFEMGRVMAERLGYSPADLDRIPSEAIESFAGVGYFFHLAELKPGEAVVDLGSGSGMDSFVAALKVGPTGRVVGVDMTDEQLAKAERLRKAGGFSNIATRRATSKRRASRRVASTASSRTASSTSLPTRPRCFARQLAS